VSEAGKSEGLRRWEEDNLQLCSFCGRRDWQLLQKSNLSRDVAICERCVAERFEVCGVNLGDGWYGSALGD